MLVLGLGSWLRTVALAKRAQAPFPVEARVPPLASSPADQSLSGAVKRAVEAERAKENVQRSFRRGCGFLRKEETYCGGERVHRRLQVRLAVVLLAHVELELILCIASAMDVPA